jgi:hypothetical protein
VLVERDISARLSLLIDLFWRVSLVGYLYPLTGMSADAGTCSSHGTGMNSDHRKDESSI